jgi:hypothetical protein
MMCRSRSTEVFAEPLDVSTEELLSAQTFTATCTPCRETKYCLVADLPQLLFVKEEEVWHCGR